MSLAGRQSAAKTKISFTVLSPAQWVFVLPPDPARLSVYFYIDANNSSAIFAATGGDQPTVTGVPSFAQALYRFTTPIDGPIVTLSWWAWAVAPGGVFVMEYSLTGDYAVTGYSSEPCPPKPKPGRPSAGVLWTNNLLEPINGQQPAIVAPSQFPGIDIASWIQSLATVNAALAGSDGDE